MVFHFVVCCWKYINFAIVLYVNIIFTLLLFACFFFFFLTGYYRLTFPFCLITYLLSHLFCTHFLSADFGFPPQDQHSMSVV